MTRVPVTCIMDGWIDTYEPNPALAGNMVDRMIANGDVPKTHAIWGAVSRIGSLRVDWQNKTFREAISEYIERGR